MSDVHGNIDGLARAAARAEQLVVLGDLLDYVDYHDHGNGILGEVFGAEKVGHFASLRSTGAFGELHEYNRQLWDSLDAAAGVLTEVVESRYLQVLEAVGTRCAAHPGQRRRPLPLGRKWSGPSYPTATAR